MTGNKMLFYLGVTFFVILGFLEVSFSQKKEDLINQIINHPLYEAKFVNNNLIKIKNKFSEEILYKDVSEGKNLPPDFEADLSIDLRTIDTAKYSELYTFWSQIPLFGSPLLIADINNDKRNEVYGTFKQFNSESSIVVNEINPDGSYDSVYKYPDTLGWVYTLMDLEQDNIQESTNLSYLDSLGWHLKILTKDSVIGYPTLQKLIYHHSLQNSQPVRINFFDLDNDSYPEMIYYLDGPGDSLILGESNHIARYDRVNNTMNLVYQNRPPTYFAKGYAFGDFDLDGKKNFSVGSYGGEIYAYEFVEGNEFNLIAIDTLSVTNAFLSTFTEDIDKNGKPELWIGGDTYINGVGSTVLFLYEASGDDQYEVVYTIEIIGVISFFAGNMFPVDLDNDGKDEVLLCIDQHVLVFKNEGSEYKLYYLKRNELSNQNSVYYSATTADFDDDGYPEIIISMDLVDNNDLKGFSRIYKKSSTVNVNSDDDENPHEYFLSEAYPNPFNSSTIIKFKIAQEEKVMIKVYNILGKEIKTLFEGTLTKGEHKITWNGTNNYGCNMPSGIYLIRLSANNVAGNYTQIIKALLLK